MRKLLVTLIAFVALGTGAAFAQSGFWAGASAGLNGVDVFFGVKDVGIEGLDVRANVGSTFAFNSFRVGAAALYDLGLDLGSVDLGTYVGGGVTVALSAPVAVSIDVLAGLTYDLASSGLPGAEVFVEVGAAVPTTFVLSNTGFIARAGLNYGF